MAQPPKRGRAEMEASTIKPSKHCGNKCSIPLANQAKPKNTGIDGATVKMGCKSPQKEIYQNTVENMQSQPHPKKAGTMLQPQSPKRVASPTTNC